MTLPAIPANGNGKTFWWVLGLFTTVVMGIAGTTVTSVQHNAERIAVLESQVQDTRTELQRINHKLDQILAHHPWRP